MSFQNKFTVHVSDPENSDFSKIISYRHVIFIDFQHRPLPNIKCELLEHFEVWNLPNFDGFIVRSRSNSLIVDLYYTVYEALVDIRNFFHKLAFSPFPQPQRFILAGTYNQVLIEFF